MLELAKKEAYMNPHCSVTSGKDKNAKTHLNTTD